MEVLKVASKSEAKSVASAILAIFQKGEQQIEMHMIGAGAVNEAVKAVIIARGALVTQGKDIKMAPSFIDIDIDGIKKTGIRMIIG
jgi:stage V sporulation protein S